MWRQEGVTASCRHDLRRELDKGAGGGAQGGDGLRRCGRCRMGRTGDGWVRALMETEGLLKVISDLFNFLDGRATH